MKKKKKKKKKMMMMMMMMILLLITVLIFLKNLNVERTKLRSSLRSYCNLVRMVVKIIPTTTKHRSEIL